jgi:LuxR family maltose regulon positive regulatory protein
LSQLEPSLADRARAPLEVGADLEEIVLPALLNAIGSGERRVTPILDDYQVITNTDVNRQVALAIDRMPTNLRLVIATRWDPPLPLTRFRAARRSV